MKKLFVIGGIALALGIVALTVYRVQSSLARNKAADAGAPERVPSVAVVTVEKKDLPQVVSITGVVRANNEAVIFPKMPGRIKRVQVEVGQAVKAGETLAAVEDVELAWRVKQADAQLKAAQAGLENAKVQRQSAQRAWNRAQSLHQKGSLSQAEFEQAEAGFALAGVGVSAAEAQVALAESAVGLANQAYADTRITTPIAGIVAKRHVDVGAQAAPTMPAFVVQDQTALKVIGTVLASDIGRLQKGMAVKVSVEELPGKIIEGKLAFIAPTLEQESRRAQVEVSLPPTEGLVPYMFGHAEIAFGEQKGVLVVPASAVLPSADGPVVYAVRSGKAKMVRPKMGARIADQIVVYDGLDAGDRVIVSGDSGLKDGIAVAVAGES